MVIVFNQVHGYALVCLAFVKCDVYQLPMTLYVLQQTI